MRQVLSVVLGAMIILFTPAAALGQAATGSLSGIVWDPTGAVVQGANVTLTNEATKMVRRSVSNDAGFFSIQAVPAATYTVVVEAPGFGAWQRSGLIFHAGDRLALTDLVLTVQDISEEMTVSANRAVAMVVDSGEKSVVITDKQVQNFAIVGRSAVELLKILPGTVFLGGRNSPTGGEVVGFDEGIGAYRVNGTRGDAVAILSDGADTIDPGCNCGSSVTPNVDMIQEVKVQTSNFSADNNKGPIVVQTVTKSGSSDFHGGAYAYLRNSIFNSKSWSQNRYGVEKPADRFFFPGLNIGGPVLTPGTGFNKKRDKAFFFVGAEWMRQDIDLGATPSWVPTEKMRSGDFTELKGGGVIPPTMLDPGGMAIARAYPLPNLDPSGNAKGYNYISQIVTRQPHNQQLARIDYSLSDSTKIYSRFNHEAELLRRPYLIYGGKLNSQIPYPSPVLSNSRSYSWSTSVLNASGSTATNEVVFAASYLGYPIRFAEPDKVDRRKLGYPYDGVFSDEEALPLLPAITSAGYQVGPLAQFGGFDPGLDLTKWLISVNDNFSKILATHVLKFGAFYQRTTNSQPTNLFTHGVTVFGTNPPVAEGAGSPFANMLLGRPVYYSESSKNIVGDMAQNEFSFYEQDSWKAGRRLTLDLGARFCHCGFMYDKHGYIAGFDPARYEADFSTEQFPGVVANHLGDDVPRSGFRTPFLKVGPRLGAAYDLTGKGNTVIRGGAGVVYYREQGNVQFNTIANPPLVRSVEMYGARRLSEIDNLDPAKYAPQYQLNVLDPADDRTPVTYSWSLTLSQRIPYSTAIELSYVGTTSRNQVAPSPYNINAVPESRNGVPGVRPFTKYGTISLGTHLFSQDYHSLQVTGNRQTGRLNYSASYTFSKATGFVGSLYGLTRYLDGWALDPRGRGYGPLSYDRTHTFAIAYSLLLPDPLTRPVLREILNGWQISGITQFQSGGPLAITVSGNLVDRMTINGTNDVDVRPVVTCDPREGRQPGQYANPLCFAAPTPGHNGMFQIPYVKHPGYQNHDLSIFKNFAIDSKKEDHKLQFRFSMYNFPNHPLPVLTSTDTQLAFTAGKPTEATLANFARPSEKTGKRIIQFAVKYFF
ncbi:MAG: carboxypeptidase regulatory-like domain-containing protein [Acidobacteria bacterium]|nr:MAG: carboxypeptidase regulatory-like domain-containing protein [Acidobacteriota bacterium]